jgi:hypothetical protein
MAAFVSFDRREVFEHTGVFRHSQKCAAFALRAGFAKRDWLLTEALACTLGNNSSQIYMASCARQFMNIFTTACEIGQLRQYAFHDMFLKQGLL